MSKTNIGLVEYAKAQLGKPYWFGTFGNLASSNLWTSKSKQYPQYYTEARKERAKAHYGKKVHDCAGLIKGYVWSDSADTVAKYNAKQDLSADAMYERATNKGTIATIPERIGLAVWRKGHIGVYIGNGKVIEAKGFDYGVVESNLKGSSFTHWLEIPLIEYVSDAKSDKPKTEELKNDTIKQPTSTNKSIAEIASEVINGKWGNGADRKKRLTDEGYNYDEVQKAVNDKLKGNSTIVAPKPIPTTDYVVQKGDTLWGIAQKMLGNGYRYSEIVTLNRLTSTIIRVGQTLIMPKR